MSLKRAPAIEQHGLQIRRSDERARMERGWIRTEHSFVPESCAGAEFARFRSLRELNENHLQPGKGIPAHRHSETEFLIYVVSGELEHSIGPGHRNFLPSGTFQGLSCGTGIFHALRNPSSQTPLHFLEIRIDPETEGLVPSHEHRVFPAYEREGRLRLVASQDGAAGSIHIHQDARIFSGILPSGEVIEDRVATGRFLWVQLLRGVLMLNNRVLSTGDGASLPGNGSFELKSPLHGEEAELLLFDLA